MKLPKRGRKRVKRTQVQGKRRKHSRCARHANPTLSSFLNLTSVIGAISVGHPAGDTPDPDAVDHLRGQMTPDHSLLYDRVRELEVRVKALEDAPKVWKLQELLASTKDWPDGLFVLAFVVTVALATIPIGLMIAYAALTHPH